MNKNDEAQKNSTTNHKPNDSDTQPQTSLPPQQPHQHIQSASQPTGTGEPSDPEAPAPSRPGLLSGHSDVVRLHRKAQREANEIPLYPALTITAAELGSLAPKVRPPDTLAAAFRQALQPFMDHWNGPDGLDLDVRASIEATDAQVTFRFTPAADGFQLSFIAMDARDNRIATSAGTPIILRMLMTKFPDDPELPYKLGLLLFEDKRLAEATRWLKISADLDKKLDAGVLAGGEFDHDRLLLTSSDGAADRADERPRLIVRALVALGLLMDAEHFLREETSTGHSSEGNVELLNALGVLKALRGAVEEASVEFGKAVAALEELEEEIDVEDGDSEDNAALLFPVRKVLTLVHINCARAYRLAGDDMNAITQYCRALTRWYQIHDQQGYARIDAEKQGPVGRHGYTAALAPNWTVHSPYLELFLTKATGAR